MQSVLIREATRNDSNIVSSLIYKQLTELFPDDPAYSTPDNIIKATDLLLTNATNYWVFLAYCEDKPIDIMTLNECTAIYAFGYFGEIAEFYINPQFRSAGIGALLHNKAKEFGKARGWSMLEVGAPDVPRWQRTVDFYKKVGFKEVGPRLYHLL